MAGARTRGAVGSFPSQGPLMPVGILLSKQNADGGWPYVRGASWTEPTVYAVLVLLACGETAPAKRGLDWLRAMQLPDGGWPPQTGFDESNWVTALAALVPPEALGQRAHARAVRWLLASTGEESTPVYRLRRWLLGQSPDGREPAGWPWVTGTAAWVVPTSLAILALDKEERRRPSSAIRARIADGRRFLMGRMCASGGWNNGSPKVYGMEGLPYPETTGLALAAIRGVRSAAVDCAVATARSFLDNCRSADAMNWLRIGLMAHGQLPAGYAPPSPPACRTLMETSLDMLVSETQKGSDILWG
jgi:prenyltransferase/squalene oxidase-like repeat protein